MARFRALRNLLYSLWDSVVDGVVDMGAHKSRSILQMVGIILGVGSVVATFGLIDGGRRLGTGAIEALREVLPGGQAQGEPLIGGEQAGPLEVPAQLGWEGWHRPR